MPVWQSKAPEREPLSFLLIGAPKPLPMGARLTPAASLTRKAYSTLLRPLRVSACLNAGHLCFHRPRPQRCYPDERGKDLRNQVDPDSLALLAASFTLPEQVGPYWGSTSRSRTAVKGLKTSIPVLQLFAASLGCGTALCSEKTLALAESSVAYLMRKMRSRLSRPKKPSLSALIPQWPTAPIKDTKRLAAR